MSGCFAVGARFAHCTYSFCNALVWGRGCEDWTRRRLDLKTYLGMIGASIKPSNTSPRISTSNHLTPPTTTLALLQFTRSRILYKRNESYYTLFLSTMRFSVDGRSFNSPHPTNPQETPSQFFTGFTSAHILKPLLTDEEMRRLDIVYLRIIWLWGFACIYGCSSFRGSGDHRGSIRRDEMAVLYLFIMHKEIKSRRDG